METSEVIGTGVMGRQTNIFDMEVLRRNREFRVVFTIGMFFKKY